MIEYEYPPSNCTPDKVPNVPREAVCVCGHLLGTHTNLLRQHAGWTEPSLHRGQCSDCECRYWITARFRVKQ
jgi:hypothetical protein